MITWACFFIFYQSTRFWLFYRHRSWLVTGSPRLSQLQKPLWKKIVPTEEYCLYLIRCRGNKYYVGITKNLHRRRKEEFSQGNRCPKWLLKHQPLSYRGILPLKTTSRGKAEAIETAFTRHLWKVYGRKNVRGGRYVSTAPLPRRKA